MRAPSSPAWFAVLEQAGVLTFDSVEDMATAAGLLARYRRIAGALDEADGTRARRG